ncbi:hypothetical protein [Lacrimispora defluvii]|uniref:Uncharacterized protein n=1 Tax=Lacrimispora defluvii TaxID=2719233 RepID=A0ABX1VR56_9FIRM|nr:hypothetical protein [Lacrimispora defluvii]NNJ30912.1 hypothetical protein [Lacrimispora defluvii]
MKLKKKSFAILLTFVVIAKAQVSPSLFIGEFVIEYIFDDEKEEFIPATINFNFEDTEITKTLTNNLLIGERFKYNYKLYPYTLKM